MTVMGDLEKKLRERKLHFTLIDPDKQPAEAVLLIAFIRVGKNIGQFDDLDFHRRPVGRPGRDRCGRRRAFNIIRTDRRHTKDIVGFGQQFIDGYFRFPG